MSKYELKHVKTEVDTFYERDIWFTYGPFKVNEVGYRDDDHTYHRYIVYLNGKELLKTSNYQKALEFMDNYEEESA